jgi:hypothetical protein
LQNYQTQDSIKRKKRWEREKKEKDPKDIPKL